MMLTDDVVGDGCLKIDVCTMECCNYRRNRCRQKIDSNDDDLMMITVAQRMSFSRVFIRHSMAWVHDSLEKLPIRLTIKNIGIMSVILAILMPRAFTYMLVYPIFRLVFGTLYPAYASYKAVRTKNVKEYVKWMMYWIVFALFTCAETFTDVFFSFWFPFYYEIKIVLVLWLLSPATKGSSILYRRFVHPALSRREAEIDEALARATEQGYTAVLHLGSKGVNYATTVLMQTAIKTLPNVSPNAVKSILPASHSESALSSLASPTGSSPLKESTKDSPDGVRVRRRRIKSDNDAVIKEISSNTDFSTDEDFEIKLDDVDNDADDDDATAAALRQDPDFKVPGKRARKPKKERGRSTSRKRRTRSTKDDKSDVDLDDDDVNSK